MILNVNGKIAFKEWLKTTEIRSNVELDVFVPIAIGMPNHIHGIIIINNQTHNIGRGVLHTPCLNTSLRSNGLQMQNFDIPLRSPSNTVGAIVRGYKSEVTSQMRLLSLGNYKQSATVWQRNFHDHIIRDEQAYQTISNYIINNPGKWGEDIFYKDV